MFAAPVDAALSEISRVLEPKTGRFAGCVWGQRGKCGFRGVFSILEAPLPEQPNDTTVSPVVPPEPPYFRTTERSTSRYGVQFAHILGQAFQGLEPENALDIAETMM